MADRLTPGQEDHQLQQAILGLLVLEHPAQRSIDEVVRELADPPYTRSARDDIHRALHDLVAAGLLHRNGHFVFATLAAIRSDELRT